MKRIFATAILFMLLAGCASGSLKSELLSDSNRDASGLRYSLPRGRVEVHVRLGYLYYPPDKNKKNSEKVEIALLAPEIVGTVAVADPEATYLLELSASSLADDHFCISVGQNGLLQSVGVVNSDRTGDIVQKFAESLAAVWTFPGSMNMGHAYDPRAEVWLWEETPFIKVRFDPDDRLETASMQKSVVEGLFRRVNAINQDVPAALKAAGLKHDSSLKAAPMSAALRDASQAQNLISLVGGNDVQSAAPSKPVPGVYYRASIERIFAVGPPEGVKGLKQESIQIMPDRKSTGWIAVTRAPMVRKQTTLALTNGTLTAVEINKPSEALAIASLPLNVAGAIIETPARFFTAIGKSFQSETAMIAAKADLLKAEAELEKLRQGNDAKIPAGKDFSGSTPLASSLNEPKAFNSGLTCGKAKD